MTLNNRIRPAAPPRSAEAECQRYYSQAAAACLARLHHLVNLLEQPLLPENRLARVYAELDDQTRRLNVLLRQLLSASALDALAPDGAGSSQSAALLPMLTSLLAEYRGLLPQQPFELCLGGAAASEEAVAPSVRLIFQLLLDNALRRTTGGQAIEVLGELDPETTHWHFHVRDAGPALAPDQLATLLDDPRQAGATAVYGLGITLAQLIVSMLGGRLWAHSEPGQGATFSFSLPRHLRSRRWTLSRPKVLLIEQDPALCATLRAGYEEAGYEVETVPSPEAGLALAPSFVPSLVLLELSPACLAALRQWRGAAVICLVPPGARAAVPDALWQGASDCVVKPFNMRELLARTRAILRRWPAAQLAEPALAARLKLTLDRRSRPNALLQ